MKFSSSADIPKDYVSLCKIRHPQAIESNEEFEAVYDLVKKIAVFSERLLNEAQKEYLYELSDHLTDYEKVR